MRVGVGRTEIALITVRTESGSRGNITKSSIAIRNAVVGGGGGEVGSFDSGGGGGHFIN